MQLILHPWSWLLACTVGACWHTLAPAPLHPQTSPIKPLPPVQYFLTPATYRPTASAASFTGCSPTVLWSSSLQHVLTLPCSQRLLQEGRRHHSRVGVGGRGGRCTTRCPRAAAAHPAGAHLPHIQP
jgi:hypothetical protein